MLGVSAALKAGAWAGPTSEGSFDVGPPPDLSILCIYVKLTAEAMRRGLPVAVVDCVGNLSEQVACLVLLHQQPHPSAQRRPRGVVVSNPSSNIQ